MAGTSPIPRGMHTITPNLVFRDCAAAIEFYRRALGAQEVTRMPAPDGKGIWHAELRIGDSVVFVNDESPAAGHRAPSPGEPAPVTIWLYVPDCDEAFRRAVDAGARSTMQPEEMFWGDRCAGITDPFGYHWAFATHLKDLSTEEVQRASQEFTWSAEQGHLP